MRHPVTAQSAPIQIPLKNLSQEQIEGKGFLADEPRHADLCIVEIFAAGPEAIERRTAVVRALARLLQRGALSVAGANQPPELTAEAVIGGISEVVYLRVVQGATADLPELLPDLAYSMMLPYLGHAAAEREAHRVTA
jgi:hypothetical protein